MPNKRAVEAGSKARQLQEAAERGDVQVRPSAPHSPQTMACVQYALSALGGGPSSPFPTVHLC
jgi:hypothetical protein